MELAPTRAVELGIKHEKSLAWSFFVSFSTQSAGLSLFDSGPRGVTCASRLEIHEKRDLEVYSVMSSALLVHGGYKMGFFRSASVVLICVVALL